MCAAILSTYGKNFDVDGFLAESALHSSAEVWHVGEKKHRDSGFQIIICNTRDLKKQIGSCVEFIRQHIAELKRLRQHTGVEAIDFRVAYFWEDSAAALAYTLPEELHIALADARATLTFCVYPCSKEEPNQALQRNAGSRPFSNDPSASETPSSLNPRG